MAKKKSLHIGLNAVDEESYGDPNELVACEADAESMRAVADAKDFEPTVLLTRDATCAAVLEAIADAAAELGPGDLFFITYSGHGGQVRDVNADEDDDLDETWCLFDTQLRDDDINTALAAFAPGVKILMLSDSCHSGTVSRRIADKRNANLTAKDKRLPLKATDKEFTAHEEEYRARRVLPASEIKATGVLISGCQDNQESKDGEVNGAFTAAFLTCWADGTFGGDHNELYAKIGEVLEEGKFVQRPNLFSLTEKEDNLFHEFLAQRPLTT